MLELINWMNLIQTFLQILYFFHPLLWFANTVIRKIREQAVDETVLAALGQEAEAYPVCAALPARRQRIPTGPVCTPRHGRPSSADG